VSKQLTINDNQLGLAELEAALTAHPSVRQSAVAVHGDVMGRRLVGYVVCSPGSCPQNSELCRHLSAALPGHIVPDVFVMVDRLPLTAGGELDRQELAKATRGAANPLMPAVVGGLPAEVADIWREVLGTDSVSMSDDFFDLGGHSLAITRISARIRSRIGVDVPLAVFYDITTVPGIVAAIEEIRCSSHDA
jgi:acyl carrier protein